MPERDTPSLVEPLRAGDRDDTVHVLAAHDARDIAAALQQVEPGLARDILAALPADARQRVVASAGAENRRSWSIGEQYPEESVGRVMEAPVRRVHSRHDRR